ncbi:MAG: hypothetical protein KUG77_10370 [Nannocystaceae bacterium]|nr:hypothetical protein [Nannocystaceae bacterium]
MAKHLAAGAVVAAACLGASCTVPLGSIAEAPPPRPSDSAPTSLAAEDEAPVAQPASDEPCPHAEDEDAKRFEYDAFGPAAMSFGLLGHAWWQWDSEGHAFDAAAGTIWVVVHDGLDGDALATRFPVVQDTQCDHRYVALPDARVYLQEHIDELADPSVTEFGPLRAELQRTLAAVDTHFD